MTARDRPTLRNPPANQRPHPRQHRANNMFARRTPVKWVPDRTDRRPQGGDGRRTLRPIGRGGSEPSAAQREDIAERCVGWRCPRSLRSGLRAPINDQDSGVDARRGFEGPAGDSRSEVDVEDSSPARSSRSRRAHPPSCCLLLENEPRRQQPAAGLEDSAEKRGRDGERWIRHDVVWPVGQSQVGCVCLHDDDLVSETRPQIVGALRVRLDRDHSCAGGHELGGDRSGTSTDVDDERARLDRRGTDHKPVSFHRDAFRAVGSWHSTTPHGEPRRRVRPAMRARPRWRWRTVAAPPRCRTAAPRAARVPTRSGVG